MYETSSFLYVTTCNNKCLKVMYLGNKYGLMSLNNIGHQIMEGADPGGRAD